MPGQVNANYSANFQKFADEINAAEILDDLLAAVRI